jgi:uncharacterized protein YbjT (DUF2867 family)
MKVILFGGTGMVGQGVLRECVEDSGVEQILLVVRKTTGVASPKVVELVHEDFFDWNGVEERFAGFDVCFFCLGISAVGMKEAEYRRTTYDLTLNVAKMLERVGSVKTFEYVSGMSTNANGQQMWARVKGETENALMAMSFTQTYCFRPGYIQPLHGVRSKVGWYNGIYAALSWAYPVMRRVGPKFVTSTEEVGRAMIAVARNGYPKKVLEMADIHAVAGLGKLSAKG